MALRRAKAARLCRRGENPFANDIDASDRTLARGFDEAMDFDEDYRRALGHGRPPAAGFDLDVGRAGQTPTRQTASRDVMAPPLLRPDAVPR
jgi:lysyl-tRNA synthetase class II